jgi:hypothetical protein
LADVILARSTINRSTLLHQAHIGRIKMEQKRGKNFYSQNGKPFILLMSQSAMPRFPHPRYVYTRHGWSGYVRHRFHCVYYTPSSSLLKYYDAHTFQFFRKDGASASAIAAAGCAITRLTGLNSRKKTQMNLLCYIHELIMRQQEHFLLFKRILVLYFLMGKKGEELASGFQ